MMAFIHIFEYGNGIGTALAKDIFQCLVHFGGGDLRKGILKPVVKDLLRLGSSKNVQLGLFEDDLEIGSVTRFASMEMEESIRAHPLLKYPRLTREGLEFFIKFHQFYKSADRSHRPSTILRKASSSSLYDFVVEKLSSQRARLKSGEIDSSRKDVSRRKVLVKSALLVDLSSHYLQLDRFVNAMILGGGEMSEGEGVNLLTVHASKGLEFEEVYVVDLMDGRFPNRKLMERTGSIEEERRLFYVAVTRAKNHLMLSMAKYDRVKKIDFRHSVFLEEAGLIDPAAGML